MNFIELTEINNGNICGKILFNINNIIALSKMNEQCFIYTQGVHDTNRTRSGNENLSFLVNESYEEVKQKILEITKLRNN